MNEEKTLYVNPPKQIQTAAVIMLSLLSLFLLTETLSVLHQIDNPGTMAMNMITVNGTGSISVAPDIAHIVFSITETAASVANAQTVATKRANAAIEYVKGQGIVEKDIKTLSYNISPQYSYPNSCPPGALCPQYGGAPKITGYSVAQTVQVTVRDLAKVSTLLGGLGQKNVENISGPDFTLDDPTSAQNAARAEAIKDAKAQANELAKELGVRLLRIVNFSEGGYYPVFAKETYGVGGAADSAPAPQVPVGENQYSSNVSITYEIR